ncbi:MAG TPA: MMPL family transporter [Solirubrobacteraceae bacterium]|nr:MMPL family transporter [Solirubrobacteraceae bacterium]
MRRLARWCVTHRLTVIAVWLAVVVGSVFIGSSTGSNYSSSNSLSGTQSAIAQSLLQRASPAAAGDSEQIVFATHGGSVTSAPVRARIQPMLARVALLPHVAGVTSPYTPAGSNQISRNGTVAFATVHFTKDANAVSSSEATTFVNTARAPNGRGLQVDVLGQIASSTNPSSQSSTMIGVVAALLVLLVVFGSLLAALLPLLSTGIALVAATSLVGALSDAIPMAGFTQQLCLLIGLGVGIDYSLFILTRTRTGLRRGLSTEEAVIDASATAGRAVLFAGITVCIALCGMFMVGVSVLSGAAIAASISVLFPMMAAQTLLPALNGLLGRRVLTRRQRRALDAGETDPPEASARWGRWAERVQTHRLAFGLAALAVMVGLAIPAGSLRLGSADYGTDPTTTTTTTHHAYELLVRGFGPGFSGPLELVAPLHTAGDRTAFGHVVAAVSRTPGVAGVTQTRILPAGPGHPAVAVAQAYPTGSPQDASTSNLITHLRDTVIPRAVHASTPAVYVGGPTALADDQATQLSAKLPLFVGAVVAVSFLLLMVVFRSVLIPATAAVMNLLSAGAAFGVITAVFENGFLGSLVGISRTGPISPLVPILMFAVLFGLSMDYEVFLVSRMHEEWLKTRSNARAVNRGQAITGRTVTALAIIMVVVFLAFVLSTDRTIKMIGLGMATAIALDALVVRTVLVPAVMHTLGDANWRLPAWLNRRLPHLDIEGETVVSPVEDEVPAPA